MISEHVKLHWVVSKVDRWVAFEWAMDFMKSRGFQPSFTLMNPSGSFLEDELLKRDIPVDRIPFRSKKDLPYAVLRLFKAFRRHRPEIVHTHFLDANLAGLTAAALAGVPKRVYTRHHSTFHWDYHPFGVWYDRYQNWLATHIIAISEGVRDVLERREHADPRKVELIHHGFRFEEFERIDPERVEAIRKRYDLVGRGPVIGVVSRFIELKGVPRIVAAFGQILNEFPKAVLVLANARGSDSDAVHREISQLPKDTVCLIPFERDLFGLYQLFDVFIHAPIRADAEGFGQVYVEALASGVPSVFTLAGVAREFVEHEQNALVIPFQGVSEIRDAMLRLLRDPGLRKKITDQGKQDVRRRFEAGSSLERLEQVYRG